MGGVVVLLVVIILVLWVLASCIRIVPQAYAVVLERLGAYKATWGTGIHFKVPFIERVARRVNLKEQVVDFPPQPVITKDNVTMQIDTVVFFQITDPKLYAYGVENPIMAIENLSATTLRNIIGDMELDETLTSREVINTKMRASLDVATDPWGIKVNRVELKNIIPPAAIQDAMEKQMKAERERREAILKAEGEKRSTILVAEGKKQSAILDAEAEKQAAIQQNRFTGMPTYFLPMRPGSRKVWGNKTRNFWCCTGTMVQSQTIYPSLIYYKDEGKNKVSVEQYINSEAAFSLGDKKVSICQEVNMDYCSGALFGEENGKNSKSRWALKFTVDSEDVINFSFRVPAWADGCIIINGEEIHTEEAYYTISKQFEKEEISVVFRSHLTGEGLSDNENITAVFDGPIVLAAIGEEGKHYRLDGRSMEEALTPFVEHTYEAYPWQQSSYRSYSDGTETLFLPLYAVTDEMYTIYVEK